MAWILTGLLAQGLFAMRFIVQWLRSERAGRSVIPIEFWYLSIIGGVLMLAYSIYREDLVFIIGQASGLLVYARNLALIRRSRKQMSR